MEKSLAMENGLTYTGRLVFDLKKYIQFYLYSFVKISSPPNMAQPYPYGQHFNLNKLESTISVNAATQVIRKPPLF